MFEIEKTLRKIDKSVGKVPFPGKLPLKKILGATRERNPVLRQIMYKKMSVFLIAFVLGHALPIFSICDKIGGNIYQISSGIKQEGEMADKDSELRFRLIQTAYKIASAIALLLVSITQARLYLKLRNMEKINRVKLENYLNQFGIFDGTVEHEKFINAVIKELELPPGKRYGLNAITYLLDTNEKENVLKILEENDCIKSFVNKEEQDSQSEITKCLYPHDLEFLNPNERQKMLTQMYLTTIPTPITTKEFVQILVFTFCMVKLNTLLI